MKNLWRTKSSKQLRNAPFLVNIYELYQFLILILWLVAIQVQCKTRFWQYICSSSLCCAFSCWSRSSGTLRSWPPCLLRASGACRNSRGTCRTWSSSRTFCSAACERRASRRDGWRVRCRKESTESRWAEWCVQSFTSAGVKQSAVCNLCFTSSGIAEIMIVSRQRLWLLFFLI